MNLGLINGYSGKALELFLSGTPESWKKGKELLDYISENLSSYEDYSFDTGILGFGWLVAYLHQQKLIDINSDEVLEDVDDQVYKLTVKEISGNKLDIGMLLGLLDYHIIRHRNKNPDEIYYRKLIHQSCLTLLAEKCTRFMEGLLTVNVLKEDDIRTYCKFILKLSYMITYFQNKMIKDNNILQWVAFLINNFKNQKTDLVKYSEELGCLMIAMKNRGYSGMQNEIYSMMFPSASADYRIYEKDFVATKGLVFKLTNIIEIKCQRF